MIYKGFLWIQKNKFLLLEVKMSSWSSSCLLQASKSTLNSSKINFISSSESTCNSPLSAISTEGFNWHGNVFGFKGCWNNSRCYRKDCSAFVSKATILCLAEFLRSQIQRVTRKGICTSLWSLEVDSHWQALREKIFAAGPTQKGRKSNGEQVPEKTFLSFY